MPSKSPYSPRIQGLKAIILNFVVADVVKPCSTNALFIKTQGVPHACCAPSTPTCYAANGIGILIVHSNNVM
ncbi:hypothetical protein EB796_018870 [Bugula neritina]|uniref:Uncharacterized protein n=1 Tax=Bugula neritina TaxID=10212 RepID=A0A7J7JAZ4_BUGNE|nr:hypothetical protein EB796_018870 [Bugula neritina]